MDPKERTRRMLAEARKKFIEHEKASRENQGKSQIALSAKLKLALPLVAIVVSLYTWSFFKAKSNVRKSREAKNQADIKLPTSARELHTIVSDPEPLTRIGPESFSAIKQQHSDNDGEFLVEDLDKKW